MNPRHAAALALVGWYLMVPPIHPPVHHYKSEGNKSKEGWNYDWGQDVYWAEPLSEWIRVRIYDSAAECWAERGARRAQAKKNQDLELQADVRFWRSNPSAAQRESYYNHLDQLRPQRDMNDQNLYVDCIATDDPRLAK